MSTEKKNKDKKGRFVEGNNLGNRFSKDNQPEKRGSNGRSITQYLRKIADSKIVSFELIITKKNGQKTTKKQSVESATTIKELLANLLIADALNGNQQARKEILDRLEGKAKQNIEVTGGTPQMVFYDARNKTKDANSE